MIKCYQDFFDSKIFKKDVYKIICDTTTRPTAIKNHIAKINSCVDIIFAFTPFDHRYITTLDRLGFDFIDINNVYIHTPKNHTTEALQKIPSGFSMIDFSNNPPIISKESIKKLSIIIGNTGRYHADPKIHKSISNKIYIDWLHNSLFNNYADKIFAIIKDSDMLAVITLKIKDGSGHIDLIGVQDEYQKNGFGKILISNALNFFKNNNISEIFVSTQGSNITANAFYQKNGFIIHKTELIYHKHIQ